MARHTLVRKCEHCLKADKKSNHCTVFTEPGWMWRKGKCWGYKPRLIVYLGGSIHGHSTLKEAMTWRLYAAGVLEAAGYEVLNPLRQPKPATAEAIIKRDLQDINRADILLVEMDHKDKPYIGTSMEIRYAWERKKEIILFGRANRESIWLQYHASAWYDDLGQALAYLKERGIKLYGDLERVKRSPGGMAEGATGTRDGRARVCGGGGI